MKISDTQDNTTKKPGKNRTFCITMIEKLIGESTTKGDLRDGK
jgi:hypothetical protein